MAILKAIIIFQTEKKKYLGRNRSQLSMVYVRSENLSILHVVLFIIKNQAFESQHLCLL